MTDFPNPTGQSPVCICINADDLSIGRLSLAPKDPGLASAIQVPIRNVRPPKQADPGSGN